jgi:hypothetical protein
MNTFLTKLKSISGNEPPIEARRITLDDLWSEGASMGRVEIDQPVFTDGVRVTIKFETKRGSVVYAKASGSDVYSAFQCALSEAYDLGAVRKFGKGM